MKPATCIYKKPVARQILNYLIQNPEADDTVEGIAKWWLLDQKIRHSLDEVETALAKAIDHSLIDVREGADGRTHYGVNPKKKNTIRRNLGTSAGKKAKRSK